jgi:poly-beta-1,6-N-acetyl-D-glucosamine synthase
VVFYWFILGVLVIYIILLIAIQWANDSKQKNVFLNTKNFDVVNSRYKTLKSHDFEAAQNSNSLTKAVSVIICMRNEEKNIAHTLGSIVKHNKNFIGFEIIVVDDHSEDNSKTEAENEFKKLGFLNFKLIQLNSFEMGKKAALKVGIAAAKNSIILQTDADCIVPENWIENMYKNLIENEATVLVGLVKILQQEERFSNNKKELVNTLLSCENSLLNAFTIFSYKINAPNLANGANIMYYKQFAEEVFANAKSKIASGDDMQLLHLALAKKQKVVLNSNVDSFVETLGPETINELLQQKTRWAAKTKHYINVQGTVLLLYNLSFFYVFISIIFNTETSPNYLVIYCLTIITVILQLKLLNGNFKKQYGSISLRKAISFVMFFPVYFMLIFIFSLFVKNKWKGRTI